VAYWVRRECCEQLNETALRRRYAATVIRYVPYMGAAADGARWLPLFGGYTALAGRILVFALAAMSFNLLLGFTGVMSFGHAAYFGLGAYGCGLCLKYVAASTWLGMLAGTLLGGIAGAPVRVAAGASPWGLFRDGDDRLRAGVFLHRL
jgi:ABC-type branched-subunit amino acid transport system permease subunit